MSMDKLDQQIQEALDKKELQSEVLDQETKTYQAIYEALSSLPNEDYLPASFADDVVSKIDLGTAKSDAEAFWWFGSAIFFMLISGLIVLSMTIGVLGIDFTGFASKYLPMMGLLSFIIVGIQWLDRRLVKWQV